MTSCNGCDLNRLKRVFGERLIKFRGSWYEKGAKPYQGQTTHALPDGTPIRFLRWFMDEGHSHDEDCAK